MKSTILVLFTAAAVATGLQTGDFFPLQTGDDTSTDVETVHDASDPNGAVAAAECTLQCRNSGTCVTDENGDPSCLCPLKFSGHLCQNEGEQCGNSYCHHGGKCFEMNLEDGSKEYICDCTHAYTETTYYAGEFCQYPSTAFCTSGEDLFGRQFCVNGGKCPSERHLPCVCPLGFSGPRCAFQMGVDGMDYSECSLSCQNGGTCHKGPRQGRFNADLDHFLTASDQQNLPIYEHCVCPLGFYGIKCEYKAAECGSGQHMCVHGSVCVKNGEDEFGCDCSSTQLQTAGLYCEHIASMECDLGGDHKTEYRGFCTNGGKCDVDADG
jgi:Notch 1